jgi:hypothetical protein
MVFGRLERQAQRRTFTLKASGKTCDKLDEENLSSACLDQRDDLPDKLAIAFKIESLGEGQAAVCHSTTTTSTAPSHRGASTPTPSLYLVSDRSTLAPLIRSLRIVTCCRNSG